MTKNENNSDDQAIDLEEFTKRGKPVPQDCKLFRIRIDQEKYIVQQAALTGRELLKLTDKDPEEFMVLFHMCDGTTKEVNLDVHFSFLNPGIERFITKKRECGQIDVSIIVNTREHIVRGPKISYEQVIELAYPGATSNPNIEMVVAYDNACGPHTSGTLHPGKSVKIKVGTVFNVDSGNRA